MLRPIANGFYGERTAALEDPFGHKWSVQSRVEDLSAEEMRRRFMSMVAG